MRNTTSSYLPSAGSVVFDKEQQTTNTQLSVVLKKKLLISFQEDYDEFFGELKKRMKISKGSIREKDSGYLFYAILDTTYDRYFDVLDKSGGGAGRIRRKH